MTRSRRSAGRADRAVDRQLPALAASLARSVRTGATLVMALDEAAATVGAPLSGDLARVVGSVRRGSTLDEALDDWQRSRPSPSVELLVIAARLGHSAGGELGPALDGAAVSLLDRVEVADEARALASQARMSARVLVALPPVGAVCFVVLDGDVARTMFTTPPGWACLILGVGLDVLGALVIARMVRGAVP